MTQPFVVENDGTEIPGGGAPGPLPDGTKVIAQILPTKKTGPREIELKPAAKSGPNAVLWVKNVRWRILDGQKGAGRNIFSDIPLFRKWKTTSTKYPNGTPAFLFRQFFEALDDEGIIDGPSFTVPGDEVLIDRYAELVLGIDEQEGYEPRNVVKFINPVTPEQIAALKANPVAAAGPKVAADVWAQPAQVAQPAAAAPAAANPWAQPVAAAPSAPAVAQPVAANPWPQPVQAAPVAVAPVAQVFAQPTAPAAITVPGNENPWAVSPADIAYAADPATAQKAF